MTMDIEKLVELFQFNENQQYDDENEPKPENNIECSSNTKSNINKSNPYAKLPPPERKEVLDPDAEEAYFEETSQVEYQDNNWKKTPKWDISYRQSVTPSDVFLGMSFKNPSTSSCENMILTVHLPGESRQNIDIKVEKETLKLISPQFFLDLNLPHPVDPKRGDAQFNSQDEKLIITLIMDRELDLLNF
ncbi:dynein axonemal assembly factor 6 [Anthonomus grandis grandis]|uniref:dynein axonemal assembly factor 6 n=1 Tax=Anthonomus grandis grandis TaxID=2921223 RepID=UPI0021664724|nr:dynein axonemal assembly factor 6 [Anthonomus grandis grandis]